MRKIYLSTILLSNLVFSQLSTPSGEIQATTNANTGNIGIGTDNPRERLDINGDLIIDNGSNHTHLRLGNRYNNNIISDSSPNKHYGGGYFFRVHNDNIAHKYINAMMLAENGNVGIGSHNPTEKLDVQGNAKIRSWSPRIYLQRDNDQGGFIQGIQTQLLDGKDNWFFGNLHHDQWIVSKGDYTGVKFSINENGNALLHGKLEAKEIKVTESPTADFVFEEDYALPTLQDVEKHIKEKKHLPEIASAKQMEKEGVNIGEFQIQLLQKIEELTLYIIELNKEIQELKNK